MKRFCYGILLGGCLLFSASCSQGGHEGDHGSHEAATATGETLSLNDGARWPVDSLTSENFVSMKTMTDMFAVAPFPALASYQQYGADMNGGLNKMISECKMSGPGHDMLHRWFEPIMKQTNELKNVSDTLVAKRLFDSVHTRVDLYKTYFTEQ